VLPPVSQHPLIPQYSSGALSTLSHPSQQREYSVSTQLLPLYSGPGGGTAGYSMPGTPASVSHSLLGPPMLRSHYSASPSPPLGPVQQHQHAQMLRGSLTSPAPGMLLGGGAGGAATTVRGTPYSTSSGAVTPRSVLPSSGAAGTPGANGQSLLQGGGLTAQQAHAHAAALQQQIQLHQMQLQQLQQRQLLAAQQQQQLAHPPHDPAGSLPPPSFPPPSPAVAAPLPQQQGHVGAAAAAAAAGSGASFGDPALQQQALYDEQLMRSGGLLYGQLTTTPPPTTAAR